jgi:uncharacterized protein
MTSRIIPKRAKRLAGVAPARLVAAVFWILIAQASVLAAPADVRALSAQGAVSDFAGILSARSRAGLEQLCTAVYRQTGVALVAVTVDEVDEIDGFANRLYERWGIGTKETDEGVLVVIAVHNRAMRIETGYGVEGYITDAHAGRIIRDIARPHLGRNDWDRGVAATVLALAELIAREKGVALNDIASRSQQPSAGRAGEASRSVGVMNLLFLGILVLFFIATPFGRAMLPWLLLSAMSGHRRTYYGGGFGGGFSRGGFGGFGGGMSGGGGASGNF